MEHGRANDSGGNAATETVTCENEKTESSNECSDAALLLD